MSFVKLDGNHTTAYQENKKPNGQILECRIVDLVCRETFRKSADKQ